MPTLATQRDNDPVVQNTTRSRLDPYMLLTEPERELARNIEERIRSMLPFRNTVVIQDVPGWTERPPMQLRSDSSFVLDVPDGYYHVSTSDNRVYTWRIRTIGRRRSVSYRDGTRRNRSDLWSDYYTTHVGDAWNADSNFMWPIQQDPMRAGRAFSAATGRCFGCDEPLRRNSAIAQRTGLNADCRRRFEAYARTRS